MNKLELNSMGVQDMSTLEMSETDGGFLLALAAGYAVGVLFYGMENPQGILNGMLDCLN